MEIKREHVKYVLDCVSGGLAMGQRDTREGASYFVFKAGKVITFNDEVYCSMPLDLGFEGAVKGEQLLNIVGRMKDETLKIKVEGDMVKISCGRRRAGFQLDGDVGSALEELEPVTEWIECDTLAPASIGDCCGCAVGKSSDKFYKTCVHLSPHYIEATDCQQFMRVWMKTPVKESTLVKAYTVRNVEGLDIAEWGCNNDWIGFKTSDDLEYYARIYRDEYPTQAMDSLAQAPEEGDAFTPPQGFVGAVDSAKIFSNELDDPKVKVIIKEDGKMMIEGMGRTGFFQEVLDCAYQGSRMEFFSSPKVLKQFAEAYTDGKISERALTVYEEGKFIYLSSIER